MQPFPKRIATNFILLLIGNLTTVNADVFLKIHSKMLHVAALESFKLKRKQLSNRTERQEII